MPSTLFEAAQQQAQQETSATKGTASQAGVPLPGVALRPGFSFRRGQVRFLMKLADAFRRGDMNHLGVFVPGYGKTITALSAFAVARAMGAARKLVVFVPRGNLRDQYADKEELTKLFRNIGAPPFSFAVADTERVFLKNVDTDIIITTYQYASGRGGASALQQFCQRAPTMFVFDEVHHLSEDGTWATVISKFPCACSVALSGTPMRSDNKTLFGVPFERRENGETYYVALHEVTMKEAHAEGKILKRVEAHVVDYHLKMIREDTGEVVEMSLSELAEIAIEKNDIDAFLARRKLRFHEVYLDSLLRPAFDRFAEKREELARLRESAKRLKSDRNHQMLVIAMSNRHARAILEFIESRFPRFSAARIGQDVPAKERERLLDDYREGKIDVMVQVDMIGEGTDIKPISMIVKADLVRAFSKTLQQIFRGMRYFDGFPSAANVCDIYSADDSQVVATLSWVTSEERMGIRLAEKWQDEPREIVRGEAAPSVWDLADVQHLESQTHVLELFPEYIQQNPNDDKDASVGVIDVRELEAKLRSDCAALAAKLAILLSARGHRIEPRDIHAEAMRRFAKTQGNLSIEELRRKKEWLERCIGMKKIS